MSILDPIRQALASSLPLSMGDRIADPPRDEFYVGYHPVAPRGLGRGAVLRGVTLLTLAAAVGVLFAVTQGPLETSTFEYGRTASYEGRLREYPFPVLELPRPGVVEGRTPYSRYWLVAPGKHGAQALTQGEDERWVRLTGSLIYRQDQTMLEVVPGSVAPVEGRPKGEAALVEDLGEWTVTGEIVDSKCFLGVMNPASRSVHRGCATRCLSGGIPPLLVVRDSTGPVGYLLLTGPQGEVINRQLLSLAGLPVRATGMVQRDGEQLVMRVDASTIEVVK